MAGRRSLSRQRPSNPPARKTRLSSPAAHRRFAAVGGRNWRETKNHTKNPLSYSGKNARFTVDAPYSGASTIFLPRGFCKTKQSPTPHGVGLRTEKAFRKQESGGGAESETLSRWSGRGSRGKRGAAPHRRGGAVPPPRCAAISSSASPAAAQCRRRQRLRRPRWPR